jgi:tetratricopeptide (TPR) repeat protein
MRIDYGQQEDRYPLAIISVFGIVLVLVMMAASVLLAFWGPKVVSGMENSIGDLLLAKGIRTETAGEHQLAMELYRSALAKSFNHSSNRAETLRRLGNLVLWNISPSEALPLLEESYNHKESTIGVFEALVQALFQTGKLELALQRAQEWESKAQELKEINHQAKAKFMEGQILSALGRKTEALAAYEAGYDLVPSGLNAYYAGILSNEQGRPEEALKFLRAFLLTGSGDSASWAREVVRSIESQYPDLAQ